MKDREEQSKPGKPAGRFTLSPVSPFISLIHTSQMPQGVCNAAPPKPSLPPPSPHFCGPRKQPHQPSVRSAGEKVPSQLSAPTLPLTSDGHQFLTPGLPTPSFPPCNLSSGPLLVQVALCCVLLIGLLDLSRPLPTRPPLYVQSDVSKKQN